MKKRIPRYFLMMLLTFALLNEVQALSDPPKREFRGTWIATVSQIDWPSTADVNLQKQTFIALLDELKRDGINVVMFQIRPECDALYDSDLEPWSAWLTGLQGKEPYPYYDPLEFALQEAHKRGMELHAWFNPYRAAVNIYTYTRASNHVTNAHPDWILSFDELRILDPGLPMVRDHVTAVVMDVVNRYDVDGIHFDDYFYPYPPDHMSTTADAQDYDTFVNYKHGDSSDLTFGNWRRENVNILMRMIHDSIQVVKPHVKFGISPFGIWKSGVPSGIYGMDAYNVIFADPLAWLQDQSIDYLTPQLYWVIGGSQDFIKLSTWWGDQTWNNGRHLYTGHIFGSSFSTSELPNQLTVSRNNSKINGSVYFSARHFGLNTLTFRDKVVSDYYRYPALLPVMNWKDTVLPNEPWNLQFSPLSGNGPCVLNWELPETAADGDSASRYVIYRLTKEPVLNDLKYPEYIDNITGLRYVTPEPQDNGEDPFYFVVTALDRNFNESPMSNIISLTKPDQPMLAMPSQGAINQRDTLHLQWYHNENTGSYHLQLAADAQMSDLVVDQNGIQDSMKQITGMSGLSTYYWRLASENPAGSSDFSEVFQFTTGFPREPLLASPANETSDVPLDTVLAWFKTDSANAYRIQLNQASNFSPDYMTIDTVIYGDTSLVVNDLEYFARRWYYWRIMASNEYGKSGWSETWMFRTIRSTFIGDDEYVPVTYELQQNYPNPFNPLTTIEYTLAEPGRVSLTVYDVLGREVQNLVNQYQARGKYSIRWDGSGQAAGVYFYRLVAGSTVITRKMVLVK